MAHFGTMPVDARDLCATLIGKVCDEVRREGMDRAWTKAVVDALRSMGEGRGFTVSLDHEQEEHGFLLDLIWWGNADLIDIALAVESVWGSNAQIWHDFGKLMIVNAPMKLMIYGTGPHDTESEDIRRGIQERMQRFAHHTAGDEYVLLEFAIPEKMAFAYHYSVPKNGQLTGVKFELLLKTPLEW